MYIQTPQRLVTGLHLEFLRLVYQQSQGGSLERSNLCTPQLFEAQKMVEANAMRADNLVATSNLLLLVQL